MQFLLVQRRVPYWPLDRPVNWPVNRYLERVIGTRFDHIAPVDTPLQASCPILLVRGLQDIIVPVLDARRIRQNSSAAIGTLIECTVTLETFDDMEAVTRQILMFLKPRCACQSEDFCLPKLSF